MLRHCLVIDPSSSPLLFIHSLIPFIPSLLPPTTLMAAEFSNLISPERDSSDSIAIDAIVSQAIDSSTLEQIAALNSSHLSCPSSPPADLDTRLQKLKSFPIDASTSRPRTLKSSTKSLNQCKSASASPASDIEAINEAEITPSMNPNRKKSSDQEPRKFSPSPPRRACCFRCSSSKKQPPKDKRLNDRDWGTNEEILTDFSTFSLKGQQRKLKAALKEEEKVSREAAKVVEWVKQASARMDASAIDDELLMSEDEKYHK